MVHAGRALRRFTKVFVPLIFLAALNGLDHAPYGNRETLARLLFAAAMVVLAILLVRLFGRTSPLMQRLAERTPRARAMRLYPAWFWALLFFPLGMLALSMAGYLTAAGYFFGRTTLTLFVVVAAAVLYGLAALWMQVRQWRLSRIQRAEAAALSAGAAAATPGDAAVAVAPPKIDLAMMGAQTRSLLDLALTVSLLAGLWWIWKDALPALSTIGDVALWSATGGDGRPATAITLSQLGFAIVIVSITWVAVRNVGALLDTLLLQRLEFRADANYAIKVVSRYAITAVGVLLASDRLGIAWSDAQWLIAALGVGLGFGLQEIVANFVSGLIVLAERPVRIGDVVTVGEVTGTVSGIMARSTHVIDFDNKEVIIPNKAFITERVVNWTLSDPTTRLVLKVGWPMAPTSRRRSDSCWTRCARTPTCSDRRRRRCTSRVLARARSTSRSAPSSPPTTCGCACGTRSFSPSSARFASTASKFRFRSANCTFAPRRVRDHPTLPVAVAPGDLDRIRHDHVSHAASR